MAKQRSPNNSVQRKRRSLVLFIVAAILAFAYFALLALTELKPSWLPAWPWLSSAKVILVALAAAIAMLGALYSNIFLRLAERTESSRPPGVKQLRDESPLLPVTYDTLIKGLGNGGEIPWIKRGMASSSLLNEHDRIAVIGPMKSGKTREAIELIRIAVQNGLVSAVFQPAGAINVIDPELLVSAVAVQLDRPCLLFVDDIGAIQDEAYLDRLSTCIDTITRNRPDARFVITLQAERLALSETLQGWVNKHRFHRVSPPDLTGEQRHELAESGTKTLGASLTPEAVAVLGNDAEIVRPWDIVWVLQAALDRKADKLPLTESDVETLLAEGEQAVWARQRQTLIKAQPAAEQLLESIGTYFSAGVTPRESSILRYAAHRMPSAMRSSRKRLHLRQAADALRQYAIVATEGLYSIPEPRLLPLIIDTDKAREQLNAFMAAYNPGFWASLAVHVLRPFDSVFRPRHWAFSQSAVWLKVRTMVKGFRQRLPSFRLDRWRVFQNLWQFVTRLLEPVYAWPADQALLAAELGKPGSIPSYLSSKVIGERGRLALVSGSLRTARDQLSMAIALNPTNAAAYNNRGVAYRRQGDLTKAIADYDRAIALDPNAVAHNNRGAAYAERGDLTMAIADHSRALQLNPTDVWTSVRRAEIYRRMGEHDRALTDFDQAIKLHPEGAVIFFYRGVTYQQMGRHDRALTDFDRAIVLEPHDRPIYTRALAYRALKNDAAAVVDLSAAIDRAREAEVEAPDDWQNKLNLALYILVSGDCATAVGRYQAALDAGIREGYARDALQDLDDYLHLFPTDEAAREMRKQLQRYVEERFPKRDREQIEFTI